jgi:CheY-like chemotaxis protein
VSSRAIPLVVALVAPALSFAQTESQFYATPKTAPEYWRAARFEIRIGNYELAAERLKGLLALNPDSKTLYDLIENGPLGSEKGMAQLLELRKVPKWSTTPRVDKEAKANIETLIKKVTAAIEAEIGRPERIKQFALALSGPPEESAFALNELKRVGKAAVPVMTTLLADPSLSAESRNGIISAIPQLGEETVPGFIAFLPAANQPTRIQVLTALRQRYDFRTLSKRADTDLVPMIWYLIGKSDRDGQLPTLGKEILRAALLRDVDRDTDPELRKPQAQLTLIAQQFADGTSNLAQIAGDSSGEAVHSIWIWDGTTVKETKVTRETAAEAYALRYSRWALDLQTDYAPAQQVFLSTAINAVARRQGGEKPLVVIAPELQAALSTASYDLLANILEDAIRKNKTPVVLSVTRTLGERAEARAIRPTIVDGRIARPALLVRALDYPDARVRFAAADAILRIPGQPIHGRADQVVKVLGAALTAEPLEGTKKALLGDSDVDRAHAVASLLQRVGFQTEVVSTGRMMMRRLQDKGDFDLVLIDRHLANPMLRDLLPQLRADFRTQGLPVMVIASPDGLTPVNMITGLARLATVVAFNDLPNNPFFNFTATQLAGQKEALLFKEMQELVRGRYESQLARMRELIKEAGFAMTQEIEDRIQYLTLQTFPMEMLDIYAKDLFEHERVVVLRLLPPDVRIDAEEYPTSGLRALTAKEEAKIPIERSNFMKKIWDSYWNPAAPKLPVIEPIRNPEIEAATERIARPYRDVKVIPAVFTESDFKEKLTQIADIRAPMLSAEERRDHARRAIIWLRRIAAGELPGYNIKGAEGPILQAIRSDELALLAIGTVAHLPSREAQQELSNVASSGTRPAPIRSAAADVLVSHIQTYGKFITDPQAQALIDAAAVATDANLKERLLALQGILRPDPSYLGNLLKNYQPKPPAQVPPVAKEKEEPKADPKEEPQPKEKEETPPKDKE